MKKIIISILAVLAFSWVSGVYATETLIIDNTLNGFNDSMTPSERIGRYANITNRSDLGVVVEHFVLDDIYTITGFELFFYRVDEGVNIQIQLTDLVGPSATPTNLISTYEIVGTNTSETTLFTSFFISTDLTLQPGDYYLVYSSLVSHEWWHEPAPALPAIINNFSATTDGGYAWPFGASHQSNDIFIPASNFGSLHHDYGLRVHGAALAPTVVSIDIKPGNKQNVINPRAKGGVWVAILSNSEFDPLQVDIPTVQFGPDEAESVRHKVKDVDKDGLADLLLRFKIPQTGIACGDTEATLTGETFDGRSFAGMGSIRTINCKLTFTPVEWTISRDTPGAGIHTIFMIADVSPLVVDDLRDIGGELIWEETQITLCADSTYPPVQWGKFISIRDVGDGFLRIGDGFQTNGQGPGCDINTTMQNAFDDFGLPKNACLSVRSGDTNYEFCAPLNVIQ